MKKAKFPILEVILFVLLMCYQLFINSFKDNLPTSITSWIQPEVVTIILLTTILCLLVIRLSKAVDACDPMEKPKGIVMGVLWLCTWIDGSVKDNVGTKLSKTFSPYVISIAIYIFISNIISLFGVSSPTANYSVTLTLTIITWTLQQIAFIKFGGFGAYMHGFIEPMPAFLPMNIFGKFSSLLSMSLRLFGNILCGSVIMSLVYSFTSHIASSIIGLFTTPGVIFNFMGPILAPVLHAYFDVFSGAIQTLIFITLTMVFVGNEIPEDIKKITD